MRRLHLVEAGPKAWDKPSKQSGSRTRRAQQQLAWTLYISEGYLANLTYALASNSFELSGAQRQELRTSIQRAKQNCADIREMLS